MRELCLFRSLSFLAIVDFAVPMSDTLYCLDSSVKCHALHISCVDPAVLRRVAAVRERWRFLPKEISSAWSLCGSRPSRLDGTPLEERPGSCGCRRRGQRLGSH